ncbi:hypothetical protein, partial [Mesorhizobium sp.]|uniref:hypothetical protein n=4 Tax=Mesorhizobium TaxID=68287 RepID=UPI00257ECBE2
PGLAPSLPAARREARVQGGLNRQVNLKLTRSKTMNMNEITIPLGKLVPSRANVRMPTLLFRQIMDLLRGGEFSRILALCHRHYAKSTRYGLT